MNNSDKNEVSRNKRTLILLDLQEVKGIPSISEYVSPYQPVKNEKILGK